MFRKMSGSIMLHEKVTVIKANILMRKINIA